MKKVKRLTICLFVLAIAVAAGAGGIMAAAAQSLDMSPSDLVFLKAFERVLKEENVTEPNILINKEPLYDLALNPLGYLYEYEIGASQSGYATVIKSSEQYDVTEIYLDADSPYEGYNGLKIYVALFVHAVYEDWNYFETGSGAVLDEKALQALSQGAFFGTDDPTVFEQQTIAYTNKVTDKYELAKRHPAYLPVNVVDNGCVPAAGANIIGFYTRFKPQLVQGFTPGSSMGNYYLYKESSPEVLPVIKTLADYMGTNTIEPGTTIAAFKKGMTRYCSEKGLKISYASNMRFGRFNYDGAKQNFQAGLPAVLFLTTFNVTTITSSSNSDSVQIAIGSQLHAMAGFGYQEITYTLSNGQKRTDTYIQVATGLTNISKGYFNINYKTKIDEVYSVNIY